MEFTRGGYLKKKPHFHENLSLDYLNEVQLTIYSEKRSNFGRDSHFTLPIQYYVGHDIVKND